MGVNMRRNVWYRWRAIDFLLEHFLLLRNIANGDDLARMPIWNENGYRSQDRWIRIKKLYFHNVSSIILRKYNGSSFKLQSYPFHAWESEKNGEVKRIFGRICIYILFNINVESHHHTCSTSSVWPPWESS